jgi:hypothetical protein
MLLLKKSLGIADEPDPDDEDDDDDGGLGIWADEDDDEFRSSVEEEGSSLMFVRSSMALRRRMKMPLWMSAMRVLLRWVRGPGRPRLPPLAST